MSPHPRENAGEPIQADVGEPLYGLALEVHNHDSLELEHLVVLRDDEEGVGDLELDLAVGGELETVDLVVLALELLELWDDVGGGVAHGEGLAVTGVLVLLIFWSSEISIQPTRPF